MPEPKKNRRRRRTSIRVPTRAELAAPPGSLPPPSDGAREATVDVLRYGPETMREESVEHLGADGQLPDGADVYWLNVDNVEDTETLRALGSRFGWHPLVLEDMVNLHQRPKAEEYDDYIYVVLLMPSVERGLPFEQLSLLVGDGYVVTVQAGRPGDTLEPIRERIRRGRGRIRSLPADYLAYAIIDAVVDHCFPIVENLNSRLEAIEAGIGSSGGDQSFEDIHAIRADLHTARRAVLATAEVVGRLIRGESGIVSPSTTLYLRDVEDHCAQLLDALEACRELSTSLMELHGAMAVQRTSERMRLLTMIATIFMPMSFIAGVYGMNFDVSASPFNMPELSWRFGYPFALGLMACVGIAFLLFFRRLGLPSGARAASNADEAAR